LLSHLVKRDFVNASLLEYFDTASHSAKALYFLSNGWVSKKLLL